MKRRITKFTVALAAALLIIPHTGWCWGTQGHELITQHAVKLLPKEMQGCFEANSRFLVTLSTLPDDWRASHPETGGDHFIDIDELADPPFTEVQVDRATAESKFGKEKLEKAGVLPWAIADRYAKLVDAFKKADSTEIVIQSAVLSHFIGDAHVPMHNTKNYDGATKEQKGVHFRWEEALLALTIKSEDVQPHGPEQVDDILKSAFKWSTTAYAFNDAIFKADDKARARDAAHGWSYYKVMSDETGDILRTQLTTASEAVAGTWIAAWKAAGSPKLSSKPAPLFWGH
jgi:hypothetical protein